jgi:geranylgeranyl diphosphate synthase type II
MERRIEAALAEAIGLGQGPGAPARLGQALGHSVFPGGARIRPTILMSVALACGDDRPELTNAAAAALELIHSASLVHDDLPCFDDANLRRGKPSVHRAFGEPVAVLAGDSLIVMAFQTIARAAACDPGRAIGLVGILADHTGMPGGICAGQGWESEPKVDLSAYHRAKTGSLFVAATRMGALASGQDDDLWVELGARIGEAFQVADDLRDALLSDAELGKPAGQDAVHARPSAVLELGVDGAVRRLKDILSGAIASIPSCPGEASLAGMVRRYAEKMVPAVHHRPAAARSAAAGS